MLQVVKTIDNHEITLVIKIGDKVMKQSQLEILLAKMDEGFTEVKTEFATKIDEVKKEFTAKIDEVNTRITDVNTKIDEVKIDVKEIKLILKKHDDLFVDHGWLNKSSFE